MKSFLLASTLLLAGVTMSSADQAEGTYGLTHPRIHEINVRVRHQDARISQALANGKITSQQATTMQAQEGQIKAEEATDKSFDHGYITKADQHALNQQLNTISRQLGGTPHPRIHEVDARLNNQTARIGRDEATGKITSTQATTFDGDLANIRSEEATETALDGGHLTIADQRSLNEQVMSVGHQVHSAAGTSGSHSGSHR